MSVSDRFTSTLLDTWSTSPPAEGWRGVQKRLKSITGNLYAVGDIKAEVWRRLVEVGLLQPPKVLRSKDWIAMKQEWLEMSKHRQYR